MVRIRHIVLAMKPVDGNFSENALKFGVAGINVDGCRIEIDIFDPHRRPNAKNHNKTKNNKIYGEYDLSSDVCTQDEGYHSSKGRFPSNVILEDNQGIKGSFPSGGASGIASGPTKGKLGTKGRFGPASGDMGESCFYGDSGSASRFFKQVQET